MVKIFFNEYVKYMFNILCLFDLFFEINYDIFWKNYNSYEIFFFVLEFDEVKFVFLFIYLLDVDI